MITDTRLTIVTLDRDEMTAALASADRALDHAWITGRGIDAALSLAKQLSEQIGRDPAIEDAKLLIANAQRCTPTEAFLRLVTASQSHNTKVAELARELVIASQRSGNCKACQ